ncbi:EamA family transporter [Microbacterium sp. NM3R9]|uniref:EamA family transporter n=1 Tax=Microbacterium thalli TaxID=3027921 RepID=UPI002367402A|nr:EamA family transporter [Microbacterium thalli]MDN8548507.1 EamA family transporter [Microbacterium thalli]
MLSNTRALVLTTALAPIAWGTTYLTATTFLPPGHPLLTAAVRALPAGLVLLALARRLPSGPWWWRSGLLGALNITVFFACLFIAADRLPGGVAAVVGGIQPLVVTVLASLLLSERLTPVAIGAGVAGALGVALIVAPGGVDLDPLGVTAALVGALSMAVGTVLTKRWGGGVPPLALTAWQLMAGGILLALLAAIVEPAPTVPLNATHLAAYAYLSMIGTAIAYVLWFRGLRSLPARLPAFLGLLSPVVAVLLGLTLARETLTPLQITGIAVVIGSVAAVVGHRGVHARRAGGECPRWDSNPD